MLNFRTTTPLFARLPALIEPSLCSVLRRIIVEQLPSSGSPLELPTAHGSALSGDEVAALCARAYARLPARGKPTGIEWTVLAGELVCVFLAMFLVNKFWGFISILLFPFFFNFFIFYCFPSPPCAGIVLSFTDGSAPVCVALGTGEFMQ